MLFAVKVWGFSQNTPLTECKSTSFIIIKAVLMLDQQLNIGYKICKKQIISMVEIF